MKFQHYEKKFLTQLENSANLKISESDSAMLVKIWRRKGCCIDCFEIGTVLYTLDFFDSDSTFIYIQEGKYRNSIDEINLFRDFLALRKESKETQKGVPIYTVFVYKAQ